MGPANIALVKLYDAETVLREARQRWESAGKTARLQERRVRDLSEQVRLVQEQLRQNQSQAGQLDLDLQSRDEHIERLRVQQQTTAHARDYQAFLIQINTEKTDRNKVEDQAIGVLEQVERQQAQLQTLQAQLAGEQAKLKEIKDQICDKLKVLQKEIDQLQPLRDAAAQAVDEKWLHAFERLAERFDGEAMSALAKPHRKREEYICMACNMSLVLDVYNRLHSRDEAVFCPSCQRMLYIPDDLPPEAAIHAKKPAKKSKEAEMDNPAEAEANATAQSES